MRRGCQKQLETFSSITFKNRFKKRRHWMLSKSSIIWNNGFPFPWFAVLIPAPQSSPAWTEVAFLEKMEFKNLDQVRQAQKSAMLSGQLQNAGGASFSTTTWLPSLGPAPSPLSSVYSQCARRVIGSKTEHQWRHQEFQEISWSTPSQLWRRWSPMTCLPQSWSRALDWLELSELFSLASFSSLPSSSSSSPKWATTWDRWWI